MHAKRLPLTRAKLILALSLLLTMPCAILGCLRPPREVTETRFVIIHQGKPIQILAGASHVTGRTLDGEQEVADVDVNGWTAMPPSHWRKVKAVLDWYAAYRRGVIKEPPGAREKPEAKENDVRRPGTP